jgi:hypothetical protein
MKRWWHLAGDAQVDDFKPGVGGVRYIAKTLTLQNFEGVEFHLATRPAFVAKSDARSLNSNSE